MTTLQLNLSPEEAASDASIRSAVARELRLAPEAITSVQIRRRNIDARQRRIRVGLSVEVYLEGEQPVVDDFSDLVYPDVSAAPSVVVVGAGPCGLFAALRLIELGLRPIVLERGQDVMQRRRDIVQLERTGIVDPESNYSYGEGGAGAFSDGKLYTRSKKRGSVEKTLRISAASVPTPISVRTSSPSSSAACASRSSPRAVRYTSAAAWTSSSWSADGCAAR